MIRDGHHHDPKNAAHWLVSACKKLVFACQRAGLAAVCDGGSSDLAGIGK
jgi:hypothetical protein